jgi:hypothetical protein
MDDPATSDPAGPTTATILLTVFQWMCKHKAKDTAAADLWAFLRVLLPEATDLGTFNRLKVFLKQHMWDTVEEVAVCVNSCIGYYDCQATELSHYKHSHRTYCPVCTAPRYLPDGHERKVFYYFPFRPWLKDLFR